MNLRPLRVAVATGALAVTLAACGSDQQPVQQPQPQPAPCIEADGEPCDEDPFDLDDLFEKHKTKAPAKTTGVKTPAAPVKQPVRQPVKRRP